MLESLLPKLIPDPTTISYEVFAYKGIGHSIHKQGNLDARTIKSRQLLNNLGRVLAGFGKTFAAYPNSYHAAVIVVCDLDDRDRQAFMSELKSILETCTLKPNTRFCLAIEEGEAWLLGDLIAIKTAYPACKTQILSNYENDSICGTWELLADALIKDGSVGLKKRGYHAIGEAKCEWAKTITPLMDIGQNKSPSFCSFVSTVRTLICENSEV